MFDPQAVRAALAPLDLAGDATLPPAVQAYLAHYGLALDEWASDEWASDKRASDKRASDKKIAPDDTAFDDTAVDGPAVASRAPDTGRPRLDHRVGTLSAAGESIVVHVLRPAAPRGTAFLLHGYFDHSGLYGHLIRYCLQRQLQVVIFDQPGHGLSGGAVATIDNFDAYVAVFKAVRGHVESSAPQPWHLFGQSMGGAVAMEYLLGAGYTAANVPYRNIVLLAPLVRPYRWPVLRLVYYTLGQFIRQWPRGIGGSSADEAFNAFLRDRDPLQAPAVVVQWIGAMAKWQRRFARHAPCDLAPVVIQGGADKTVDAGYNLRLIGRLFRPVVHHVPAAQHHLVNETAELRAQVFAGIDAHWRE